jgi:hypothetical protein
LVEPTILLQVFSSSLVWSAAAKIRTMGAPSLVATLWDRAGDNPLALLLGALAAVLVPVLVSSIRAYRRLAHFGGPWYVGLTRWWLMRAVTSGELHLRYWDMVKKYGTSHLALPI